MHQKLQFKEESNKKKSFQIKVKLWVWSRNYDAEKNRLID